MDSINNENKNLLNELNQSDNIEYEQVRNKKRKFNEFMDTTQVLNLNQGA